jgi:molybdopterin/thiamine biosynthesis adenylyltransferase
METIERNRFKDALWFGKDCKMLIGGSGGIGSWLAFFLTRAGFSTTVYDFDTVEAHNLGGQLFKVSDVGKPKVDALTDVIEEFNGYDVNITTYNLRLTHETDLSTITRYYHGPVFYISAFDNMEARKILFSKFKLHQSRYDYPAYFIDGRLLMEQMRIYCFNQKQEKLMNDYETNHLFDDSEVIDASCTMKQVSHTAAMIASHMTAFITNAITNMYEFNREEVFKVPYIWDYLIPNNLITETHTL